MSQFVLGDIFREGDVVPFRNALGHKYSIQMPKQRVILLRIEQESCWKIYFGTLGCFFLEMGLVKLKNDRFRENLTSDLS